MMETGTSQETTRWQPNGEITIFEAEAAHRELSTLLLQEGSLELHLDRLSRIDTAGVQLVVSACTSGRASIHSASSGVIDALRSVGCEDVLPSSLRT
jgi:anti-anti-sigma regulatory factor